MFFDILPRFWEQMLHNLMYSLLHYSFPKKYSSMFTLKTIYMTQLFYSKISKYI